MKKKMRIIPSIFKNKEAKQLWQWPLCTQLETLSFRASKDDVVFKTVNSIFIEAESPESLFTNSSESPRFSTDEILKKNNKNNDNNENDNNNNNSASDESLETIIRGVRLSERLFFEPGETNSIMNGAKINGECNDNSTGVLPFKESVAMAMESDDPYLDFKISMEEMVESHGVKDWEGLEELLGWYLKMNGKNNHGFIVGAFMDLLMGFSNNSSSNMKVEYCTDSTRYSTADSTFTSSSSTSSPRSFTGVVSHEDIS